MRIPAQMSIETKGVIMTTTTTTIDLTAAIREGILTFEQAMALQGMAMPTTTEDKPATTPKKTTPKKTTGKKSKKTAQPEVRTMDNGRAYHTPKKNSLTAGQVKRLDAAVAKVRAAGYPAAEWRVEGCWAWIYTMSEEKGVGHAPAFKTAVEKAFKNSKWAYSGKRGAVVYKDFIK